MFEYEVVATIHRRRFRFLFWEWCVDTELRKPAKNYLEASSLAREVREMVGEAVEENPSLSLTVNINRIAQ